MQQFIYLMFENELVGGAVVERAPYTQQGYPVYSRLLVCPQCCQVWAKLTIAGDPIHRSEMASCMHCPWTSERVPVPGSLLTYGITGDNIDWDLLEILPESLLRREFSLTLEALVDAA